MRNLILLCAAVVLLVETEPVSAQSLGAGSVLPTRRQLDRYGLELAWWNHAKMNASRETVRYLTTDEQLTFVQSSGGIVTALDAESGQLQWAVQLGRQDDASYPVVTNDDLALVNVGKSLYALNKFTGKSLWSVRLPNYPSASPATDRDNIYVGTLDGSMYALDLRKIAELYTEDLLPEWSHQTIRWRYKTGREVTTPPIVSSRSVSFASTDRSLYSVTVNRRELIFQFETDAPVSAPVGSSRGLLFLASEDSYLYCIDAENGGVRWDKSFGLPLRLAPRVIDNDLYMLPIRGGIFCLTADGGHRRWWRPKITKFLAASRDVLYVSDYVKNVALLSRETGAVLGALPLQSFSVRMENDRTDRLYMATPTGTIVCLREKGSEFPIYHKFPDRRPILPLFADDDPPPADPNVPPNANPNGVQN